MTLCRECAFIADTTQWCPACQKSLAETQETFQSEERISLLRIRLTDVFHKTCNPTDCPLGSELDCEDCPFDSLSPHKAAIFVARLVDMGVVAVLAEEGT